MNDLISRQAAIDLFPNDALEWDTNFGYIAPHYARRMIEELPSAQPEIIRCKDCRYYFKSDEKCQLIVTRLHFYAIDKRWTEDSFCSWAEREDNG